MASQIITYRTPIACPPKAKRSREPNDCTVVALAVSTNLSYRKAYAFWDWMGRKPGRGIYVPRLLHRSVRYYGRLPVDLRPVLFRARSMTLKTFLARHPKGRYFVLLCNHAVAVVDGQAFDWIPSTRRLVIGAWRIGQSEK